MSTLPAALLREDAAQDCLQRIKKEKSNLSERICAKFDRGVLGIHEGKLQREGAAQIAFYSHSIVAGGLLVMS